MVPLLLVLTIVSATYELGKNECKLNHLLFMDDLKLFQKYILILSEGLTQGLDGTTLTAGKMYSVNLTAINTRFCLSLHYNGATSYLFVNGTEIIKFKGKDSETVANALCLGSISEDFPPDSMKQIGLVGSVYDFSVDYDAIVVITYYTFTSIY